jgi:protein SCO1/2
MSTRGIIILLFCSFVLFVVSIYALMKVDPGVKPKPEMNVVVSADTIGGDFKLRDVDGKEVTQNALLGKTSLVYFGYGHCPDTCPAALNNITEALKLFSPQELDLLQVFFVTLDPKRDTPEYLKKFISSFHPKITPLLGDEKELERVSAEYKVYSSKQDTKSNVDYLIDHSSLVYVMNRDGKYALHFASSTSPSEMHQELRKLLTESSAVLE